MTNYCVEEGLRIAVLAEFGRNLVLRLPFLAAEGGPPRAPKSRGRLGYSSEKDIFERKFAHPIAKRTWMGEKMADIKGQNRGSADITSIQAFRGPGRSDARTRTNPSAGSHILSVFALPALFSPPSLIASRVEWD